MSRFATRFKHRQHTENITDDDECPIHLFNYPCCKLYSGTVEVCVPAHYTCYQHFLSQSIAFSGQ